VRKIATFVFKYRPLGALIPASSYAMLTKLLDVLQYHSIAPMSLPSTPIVPQLGDKRCAPDSDSDDDLLPELDDYSTGLPSPTIVFAGSDSDSSQVCIPISLR